MKTADELNQAAMQIILSAGDCRKLLGEAVDDALAGSPCEEVYAKVEEAKALLAQAHVLQTDMIQDSIECEELNTTLLFTHAQDTLMTISSEVILMTTMLKLYFDLKG